MTRTRRARLVAVLLLALVVGALVPSRVAHVFTLDSASMLPTLEPGDWVVANRQDEPGRGDLVVFRDPGGWVRSGATGASPYLVKRVIGVPSDRVSCCSHGALVVNGAPLAEPYLAGGPASALAFDVTVPDGALWVMGDNRGDSRDSRSDPLGEHGGAVDLELVVGVVSLAWGSQGVRTF
ncbi:signal peptidase I [Jiangella aurantiaca]|uniref:Signal peptidase I n=1 Tax=Jiangella aurantiaca TaxID=2530373 RepID=A0A4V2YSF6_9ACTN|nr:signal peptidase I [Jiangella aurantiaca]TDD69917.1 signal peptidase I [Jiangella aurantiaca]